MVQIPILGSRLLIVVRLLMNWLRDVFLSVKNSLIADLNVVIADVV